MIAQLQGGPGTGRTERAGWDRESADQPLGFRGPGRFQRRCHLLYPGGSGAFRCFCSSVPGFILLAPTNGNGFLVSRDGPTGSGRGCRGRAGFWSDRSAGISCRIPLVGSWMQVCSLFPWSGETMVLPTGPKYNLCPLT